jgi:lipopolysaccharide transport system ATP-binding protein
MDNVALRAENLGKIYRIGERHGYKTLRDAINNAFAASLRRIKGGLNLKEKDPNYIWALKDVSFEIKKGEIVGIIGRNGAGKTTLLKILSRITPPTEGYAAVNGRIGSLLEIGTGFHPELTGRDNIYLNGSILGMKKREIDRKFDEIVAFAELEKFIDTPVKHYSGGMYVRLAFAVAAHLEPEILLVDEVLAVGDAAFQRRCLGKMNAVASEGRTVLFVSHNMASIQGLCQRGILLDTGRLIAEGHVKEVVQRYLQSVASPKVIPLYERQDRSGDGSAKIVSLQVESTDQDKIIRTSSRLKIKIGYASEKEVHYPKFLVGIYDGNNTGIFLLDSDAVGGLPETIPPQGSVTCITEPINLTGGRCFVNIALMKGQAMVDYIQYAGYFDIESEDIYGSGKVPRQDWVLCVLRYEWNLDNPQT